MMAFINQKEIGSYLKDVRKFGDIVSHEEEIELMKRVKEGDKDAEEKIIKANLRFVLTIAKQYQNQGLELSDLISEGNYGLMKAVKKFSAEKDCKFISYAVWWIKQAIKESLNKHARTVRIPVNQINEIYKNKKEGIEDSNVVEPVCFSLNSIINDEGDELIDIIPNDNAEETDKNCMTFDLRHELNESMSSLSERERDIIQSYYGLNGQPMTLEAIGDEYGLTKERVRQLKQKGLRKIRSKAENLFKFYE